MVMLIPLFFLAIGAVFSGFILKEIFIGHDLLYIFWGDSIKFLQPLSSDHPPTWFLILTPALVVLSIPLSFYVFVKNKTLTNSLVEMNKPLYNFLKNKWYFDEMYNYIFVNPLKKTGLYLWKKVDGEIIDRFGPDGISKVIKYFSLRAVKFQSGFIYQYAFVMLIGFSLILTYLIIN